MDVKIINKSVVPDRIVLYEGDRGSKNLVFYTTKVNDGVNVEVLNGYLEIERESGETDRFLLDKTIADNSVYFTLPIGLTLTETADVLSSQVVFENDNKTLSYRTKVFYIDVKFSVDGESSYEQVLPSVITQLETKLENAVETCENLLVNGANDIKEQVLNEIEAIITDSELSLDSENPVQNKVITEALNEKVGFTDIGTKTKAGVFKLGDTIYTNSDGQLTFNKTATAWINKTNLTPEEYIEDYPNYFHYLIHNSNENVLATLATMPEMVKVSLCYPRASRYQEKQTNWSEEEKALARATLGTTKLYKHTVNFTADYSYNGSLSETHEFTVIMLATQSSLITYTTNWFNRPENCVLVDAKCSYAETFKYGYIGDDYMSLNFYDASDYSEWSFVMDSTFGFGWSDYSNMQVTSAIVEEL